MSTDIETFKKSNKLIESYFHEWDKMELILLNSLLIKFWETKHKDLVIKKEGFIVSYKDLRELMYLTEDNNYKSIIRTSLLKIKETTIVLNNFNEYGRLWTSFIHEFGDLKEYSQSDKNQMVEITLNKKLFDVLTDNKYFSMLDKRINKYRSKYTLRLYDLIKMKSVQHNPKTKEKNFIVVKNLAEMNEWFITKHKYISKFKHHLLKSQKDLILDGLIDSLHIEYFSKEVHFVFNKEMFNPELFD